MLVQKCFGTRVQLSAPPPFLAISIEKWQTTQTLHWKGQELPRRSQEYQELLDRAFDALAQNEGFQRALGASGDAVLTHSMGKRSEAQTVLTIREFCGRLTKLREKLRDAKT